MGTSLLEIAEANLRQNGQAKRKFVENDSFKAEYLNTSLTCCHGN